MGNFFTMLADQISHEMINGRYITEIKMSYPYWALIVDEVFGTPYSKYQGEHLIEIFGIPVKLVNSVKPFYTFIL